MSNSVSDRSRVQTAVIEYDPILNSSASSSASSNVSKEPVCLTKPANLPYQANHQVELLHLQAEIEALLQQLKTLKQQRLASVEDSR
ncbi:MAG: hypothetical protein HC769_22610 [Cyanobacteria bacterium CRU_2_1]|nr:hypothetical protein [Cyanobacteria bacterium RU_5_0]NJR61376.1 hypothetical protein [Cyanobacteria bacterium CRU_2_1]